MPEPSATLRFRAGREEDQPQIAVMTKDIWEGHDYLSKVWHKWLHMPRSLLRVGLLGEEIVATGRVVEQVPGGWWLEGVRVHPAYQGQGFARLLYDHLVELAFQQPGIRWLGLTTASDTKAMAHLAQRSGMRLRCEYRYLRGSTLLDAPSGVAPHDVGSIGVLLEHLQQARWLRQTGGFAMNGWAARPLDERWLGEIVAAGGVWRCGEALALTGPDSYGSGRWLYLLAGGSEDEQERLSRYLRYLTYQDDPQSVLRCFVPLDERLERPLVAAGLHDPEGDPFSIYHFVREQGSDAL